MHANEVMISWCAFSRFCWLWVMRDIRWGARLALLAIVGESGHVSTLAEADPVLERVTLKSSSERAPHAKRENYLYVGLSNSESRPLNTVVLSSLLKSHSRTLRSSDPLIINPRPDERLTELKSLVASVESTRWPD